MAVRLLKNSAVFGRYDAKTSAREIARPDRKSVSILLVLTTSRTAPTAHVPSNSSSAINNALLALDAS